MTQPDYSVDFLSEGDVVVRGTEDPMQALAWTVDEADDIEGALDLFGARPDDGEVIPEAVDGVAEWCHQMLATARVGYYRKVACLPNSYGAWEGWRWQLQFASGPGPGAFRGVYFRGFA